jgi:hypothetical protein
MNDIARNFQQFIESKNKRKKQKISKTEFIKKQQQTTIVEQKPENMKLKFITKVK